MKHDTGPSRASRCPHKTITAFDIAPHNVGDSRALVDDRHPWVYRDERMQRRSLTQLGPSTCKGCDSPGDQPMGPVSRKEARSDDRKMRPRFGRRTKGRKTKTLPGGRIASRRKAHSRMNRSDHISRSGTRPHRRGVIVQLLSIGHDHPGTTRRVPSAGP